MLFFRLKFDIISFKQRATERLPPVFFLPLRACCLPLNSAQCLLQQGTQVVIALLSLLVEFHKEIGSGLQCLVNGAGVLAVDCQFFEPLYKAVKE